MLVLIAGLTGTVGQEIVKATLAKGHKVRGLARSPDKLNQDVASALESFVQMKDVYDITAFDNAVQGVDAIVCAWNWAPEVTVDGQILLLRAAERAGVKVSVVSIVFQYHAHVHS
jgi:putative NADH-flavin reductase